MKRTQKSKIVKLFMGVVLGMFIFIGMPAKGLAYTETAGIVSADAAKVRKEPNTSSDVVAGLLRGSTVMVTDEVTDSAGMVWYKVNVENNTGYIRSDLLIKATTSTGNTTTSDTTASNTATQTESKPEPTTAKAIAETKAYVNFESARVREGASTNHEIVGSAVENTPVVITGEAKGNDGKLWYQVKYNNAAGREVTGFIRSDLLTIGEPPAEETPAEETEEETAEGEAEGEAAAEGEGTEAGAEGEGTENTEVSEETQVEEPAPEETVKPDYEMVYTQNNEGVDEWYLYDNINGTRQTLAGLMAAAEAGTNQSAATAKQMSTQKIIIIVLAVIVAILAVTVTLLLFKIKDFYDEGYEDYDEDEVDEEDEEEDEDDEEEEISVVRKKRSSASERSQGAARVVQERVVQEKPMRTAVKEKTAAIKSVEYDPEEESYQAGASVVERQQPKRKAKNFLVDDEFEFEFLNMDDKK